MKNTQKRSIVVYFLTFVFISGIGFFITRLIMNANIWALSPYNAHLSGDGLADAGKILDRNEVILAQSKDGKRSYHEDLEIRKAVLHTVGDNSQNISTSVQQQFHSELFGYHFVTGINPPEILKKPHDIILTLDSALCKTALTQLGNYKGCVIVSNYKTGEILCMVSTPTYDPNTPPDFEKEPGSQYEGAYLNRALSSSYTPGSVFKVITAVSAIEYLPEIYNEIFTCHQKEVIEDQTISCTGYHGQIGFQNAMKESCNIAFANIAIQVGKEKMAQTALKLGFNQAINLNGIQLKQSYYHVSSSSAADLGWSGIGQLDNLLNPMHMVIIMGAIANQGTPIPPNLILSPFSLKSKTYSSSPPFEIPSSVAEKVKEIMRYTVKNKYGDSLFPNLEVCAKTGTAEVGKDKQPHSWVVGFSANPETPLAFTVIVENSGYGSKIALPIASTIMKEASKIVKHT